MKSNQRDGPLIAGGIGIWVLVAVLTVFAVVSVINKLNDNADRAYAAAVSGQSDDVELNPSESTVQNVSQEPDDALSVIDSEGNINPSQDPDEGTGIPVVSDPDSEEEQSGGEEPESPSVMQPEDNDLPVGDGQDSDGTLPETKDQPGGNGTADVSSEGNQEQGNSPEDDSPSEEDSSDSKTPVDVGFADGTRLVGMEYLSIGPDGTAVYHVVWGDTLSDISRKLGFDVDELADYNKVRDVNLIYADSLMRVPLDEASLVMLQAAQTQKTSEQVQPHVNTGPDEAYD